MGPPWAQAFLAAGLVTLAGTPLIRRLALAADFVDRPQAAHKGHHHATPYLGGVGLIVAVLLALLFTARITPLTAVIALGGTFIGCLGLLDDHRSVGTLVRLAIEAGVAAVALAAGLRIHATDIPLIDGLITIVWIVGVTNAVNLLDNMDGLAAGVSAAAAGAIFALAVLSEQSVATTLAAGLVGACIGFLAHNKRPASIFMGDTGSLFLGFVLAVVTIDVSPNLAPPTSFAVPVMLLAMPVLDTATVIICRLRRRRSVAQGGRDHLSHKLVARGLTPGVAVAVLVAVEAGAGALAVLAGRRVLALPVAVAAVALMLAVLAVITIRAPVYTEPVVGLPRRLKLAAAGGIGLVALLAAPAVVALVRAHQPGTAGARAASHGLDALAAGDAERATALFDRGARELQRADTMLNGPLTSLGLAVPGLRANVATARALVDAGLDVAVVASDLSAVVSASALPLPPGPLPVREGARLAPDLSASASVLQRSAARLTGCDRPYLWPSIGTTVRRLRSQLDHASSRAAGAADVARLAPALLGGEGSRRYLLVVQDNTELRGSGGVVRQWGELAAEGGRLRLVHLGSSDELNTLAGVIGTEEVPPGVLDRYRQFDVAGTWQNANVSPDFEVTGQVLSSLFARSGGSAVDGVISVDLPGLAALLRVTGPVRVDGWPEFLDARTLVDVVVRDSYTRFPAEADRRAFLTRVTRTVVEAFTTADLGTPSRLALTLGDAARAGHLRVYATRPDEQVLSRRLGTAGEVPSPAGDSLLIVNQNLSATGIDTYMHRTMEYSVSLDPGATSTALKGQLRVTLRNEALAAELPKAVAGPQDHRLTAGENRTYLSMYTPLSLVQATVDGRPTDLESDREFGHRVYSTIVRMASQQARTVELELVGTVAPAPNGWYHLDVLRQTALGPDNVSVSLSVPPGWRIVDARGLRIDDSRRASVALRPDRHEKLSVRLERTPWSRLWAAGHQH